ncbi:MAG TPA: hypothetical protein PLP17_02285 [Oligoflexia bacterium]|nr:hypothetical protein [Oligoflexia bacterium]
MSTRELETICSISVQNTESITAPAGRNCPLHADSLVLRMLPAALSALRRLAERSMCAAAAGERLLSIEQLEMLEAELQNQRLLGRLPAFAKSVHQHALQQASIWRWKARRLGVRENDLRFQVNLHQYLICYAEELLYGFETRRSGLRADGPPSATDAEREGTQELTPATLAVLQYLNRFAAYLDGQYESGRNRYERGLNVVLRVLNTPAAVEQARDAETNGKKTITLPLTFKAFARLLKSR